MTSERRTLLVVDDEPSLRITLAANLEDAGYDVIESPSADAALAVLAARDDIALVVSDIRMPGMDGIELNRRVKAVRPGLPVVMMTAYTAEAQVEQALAGGAFTVVHKPFDTAALLRIVARALTKPVVLIVDDSLSDREGLVETLAACGCRTACVAGAAEALAAVASETVDVAVVDLVMPDKDGVETLEELHRAQPGLPVLMMTGYSVPQLVRRAAERGTVACLRKPFDIRQLLRVIAEVRARGA